MNRSLVFRWLFQQSRNLKPMKQTIKRGQILNISRCVLVEFCNNTAAIIIRIFISPYRKKALCFQRSFKVLPQNAELCVNVRVCVCKTASLPLQQLHLWEREGETCSLHCFCKQKKHQKSYFAQEHLSSSLPPPHTPATSLTLLFIGWGIKSNNTPLLSFLT